MREIRPIRVLCICPVICLVIRLAAARAGAAEGSIECRVQSEDPGGIAVDAGEAQGLRPGAAGIVERGGEEIARVEVIQVLKDSAILRIVSTRGLERPRPGDRAVLEKGGAGAPAETGGKAAPAAQPQPAPGEPFVPLLAPYVDPSRPRLPSNVFHGRLRARQLFQLDSRGDLDYSRTQIGSDGTLERIGGRPWTLGWSGDLYYRDGGAYEDSRDYREGQLQVYRLDLFRPFEGGGFLRAGRFLPRELPEIGYMDGAQVEKALSQGFRLGAVAGLKPDRFDLEPTGKEPTATVYATAEAGERRKLYYSGTLGVLASLYEGEFDRLAFLLDQRADLGPKLSLFSNMEVDVNAAGEEGRDDVQLTHLDLYGSSPITSFLVLRAGLDHYERPDTLAERDLLPFEDDRFFDRGYWRYWVGSSQYLPWSLRLDEELALIDAPDEDFTPRWTVSATRTGLFSIQRGQVTLTVFNLDGAGAEGYGGRLFLYLPFLEDRLSFRPSAGFRLVETDDGAEQFQLTDLSLYGDWWISRSWRAFAGASYAFGDYVESLLVDLGIEFRW